MAQATLPVRSHELVNRVIEAWNVQDVDAVVQCYTDDLVYVDPNTRGPVRGRDAMRRYLTKLYTHWHMHWTIKEAFPLNDGQSGAYLWCASLRKPDGEDAVEVHGMDLVLMRDDLIARNEVYFDRALLAPRMGFGS